MKWFELFDRVFQWNKFACCSYFSLTLKEKLSLHNLEAIIKHIRERVENGQEVSIKEISTLPLSELLVCWKTSDEVSLIFFSSLYFTTLKAFFDCKGIKFYI
jgi:transcriptional regulator NrdR family protein